MSTDPPARRRRTYVFPGRQKRLSIRVTDGEDAEIANAANQLGLTPTGSAPTPRSPPHAGTTERMEHETLTNLQAEPFQARVALNQLRAELSRTRHDERASPDGLDTIIARAASAPADLDAVVSRVHRRLAPPLPVNEIVALHRSKDYLDGLGDRLDYEVRRGTGE